MTLAQGVNGRPVAEYLRLLVAGETGTKDKARGKRKQDPLDRDDAELIETYLKERQTMRGGVTDNTAKGMASYLVAFSRLAGPFRAMKKKDLIGAIDYFRKNYKQTTQARALIVTRAFLEWLIKNEHNPHLALEVVREIKAPSRRQADIAGRKAGDMLNSEELKALIAGGKTSRDRAMLALLFESAMRPKELALMRWGDLVDDQYGYQLSVRGKTHKTRYVRLIFSKPYIAAWKNDYPGKIRHDSPVFVGRNKNHAPITQSLVRLVVYDAAKRAALGKKCFPYLLRHSRITLMVADEVPLPVILEQAWGSQDGRMLSTYLHLKNTDVDRIMLERAGIRTEKREVSMKAPQCPRCGTINPLAATYCMTCTEPLTEAARAEITDMRDEIHGTDEYRMAEEQYALLRDRLRRDLGLLP